MWNGDVIIDEYFIGPNMNLIILVGTMQLKRKHYMRFQQIYGYKN